MKTQRFAQPTHPTSRGFTLVELLITITIILVLAALSFSSFARMRTAAYKVVTMRNVGNLQTASTTYAAEHNGRYLPSENVDDKGVAVDGRYWFDNQEFLTYFRGSALEDAGLQTRVDPAYLDPVAVRSQKAHGATSFSIDGSFGYNPQGMPPHKTPSGLGFCRGYFISEVIAPARSMSFITCTGWNAAYSGHLKWNDDPLDIVTENPKIAYRYNGKAICVYYDSHIGEISMAEMKIIDDDQSGVLSPFWTASNATP